MHLHETQSEYCMEVCNFVKLQPLTKGRWNPWWSNIHKNLTQVVLQNTKNLK
jgi:hypothetical protein